MLMLNARDTNIFNPYFGRWLGLAYFNTQYHRTFPAAVHSYLSKCRILFLRFIIVPSYAGIYGAKLDLDT